MSKWNEDRTNERNRDNYEDVDGLSNGKVNRTGLAGEELPLGSSIKGQRDGSVEHKR